MLLNKRPIQVSIVLYELALRGDRGLSSYRAYDNNFRVKRLAARIWDLQEKWGCVIETHGSRPAVYTLKSVPPETVAVLARGEPELMTLIDHYLYVDVFAMEPNKRLEMVSGETDVHVTTSSVGLPRCVKCGSGMGNLVQKDGRWEHDEGDVLAAGFCAAKIKNGKQLSGEMATT